MSMRDRYKMNTLECEKVHEILSHPGFMWQQLTDELYHIKWEFIGLHCIVQIPLLRR